MAQQAKVIATKAEDLNSILGIHMAEETDFYKMSFDTHVCNMWHDPPH